MTQRHVWIVNHHAAFPSKDGRAGRHFSLARHLPKYGWTATLLTASTTHPSGRQRMPGLRLKRRFSEDGIDILCLRAPAYGSSMARRLLGMVVFALHLLAPTATRSLPKPDLIIGSTVHPFAAWAASRMSRRLKVPFVYEVRDVWPETLIQLGKLRASSFLARTLRALSVSSCRAATLVIAPLPGLRRYLDENGFADVPFAWISNGVEPQELPLSVERDSDFVFMYLGSHGNANALEDILSAFDRACELAPGLPMKLRLVGDGPLKPQLQAQAQGLSHGDRIHFEDRIPRDAVLGRAREADCLVAKVENHAVYQYGISLNKLFDYQLAGRPIVFASTALNDPIAESASGMTVQSNENNALADALVAMASLSEDERQRMGERGRAHVLGNYTYEALAGVLAANLSEVADRSPAHRVGGQG